MARLVKFRSLVAESLGDNNAIQFQGLIKKRLTEILVDKQQDIHEAVSETPENKAVVAVGNAAKSYGGFGQEYGQGILEVSVPSKQAAKDLASYLDTEDTVNSYEINTTLATESGNPVDLMDESSAEDVEYQFRVFFEASLVKFDGVVIKEEDDMEDDDEEEDDDTEEMEEKKNCKEAIEARSWLTQAKLITEGTKEIVECPVGYRWSIEENTCVKVSNSQLREEYLAANQKEEEVEELAEEKPIAFTKMITE